MVRYFLLIQFISFLFSCQNKSLQVNDIDLLKSRLVEDAMNLGFRPRTDRYIESDFSLTNEYLRSMNEAGSWSDINYFDEDNNWDPLKHLDRVLVMSIGYANEESSTHKKEILNGLGRAISYWYEINPTCRNWYKNDIAKQFYLNIIGLLLDQKISLELQENIINDLTATPSRTGSNRTLFATSTIYRGVLENNPARIMSGVQGVTDQVIVTTREGIQPDFSFHQHGHFVYNGSYGHNFLRESIWLANMVHDTEFAYSESQIKILRNYYLNGTRWMLRGGLIDYNVRGRQVGRPGGDILAAKKIIPQLDQFMIVDPEFSKAYQLSKTHILLREPQNITGTKHFWRSDYTVHHSRDMFTSLKMCSERTVGIELNMNSENKLGYWLPYGLTYMYRRGNEYQGIFPAWDWARLPGVTCPYVEYEEKEHGKAYSQVTSFVGGVSNGKVGVSSMHFSKENTEARKSWFWFDQEWVALGAGVCSTHEAPIVTGVNQCLINGKVIVDGMTQKDGLQTLQNPSWVLHDSIGYIFPGSENIEIMVDEQQGNLRRIYGLGKDTVYTPHVFSLWFDHGVRPQDETYQYIVVPSGNVSTLQNYVAKSPIRILNNNKKIQAVQQVNTNLIGIVFHEAGEFVTDEITVYVDKPCLVLLDVGNDEMSVSDPTAKLEKLNVSITFGENEKLSKTIVFPIEEYGGKSKLVLLGNPTDKLEK